MTRHVFIFLATFATGALLALVARAALFAPHATESPSASRGDYAGMVSNSLVPAGPGASPPASAPSTPPSNVAPADRHQTHAPTAGAPAAAKKPVNTVCAICGMDVDPKLGTAEYQGKTIGFGCKMCEPMFKADPDRYGPYYLRNEVIKQ